MLKRIFFMLLSLVLIVLIVYFIEPPLSWENASIFQILVFFVPLLLFFTTLINLFLNYTPGSFALGLGFMFIIVLWAVNLFNFATFLITFLITLFLFISARQSLTKYKKIHTLSKFRRLKL